MTVPKQKHTKSKRNRRRSHLALKAVGLSVCPKCGKEFLAHAVCPNCGYYKGKMVVDVLEKLTKKEKKARQKEMKAQEKAGGKKESPATPSTMEELAKEQ